MDLAEQKNKDINLEFLARSIWDSNLKYRGKIIIAIEALLGWCGAAVTFFSQQKGIANEWLVNGLYLLLVLLSCEKWMGRYLHLDNGKIWVDSKVQNLIMVMRFHAFDVESYFKLIRKSLWKLQIFHLVFWLIRCVYVFLVDKWAWQRGIPTFVTLFVALICPYVFCWLKKKYYAYCICHSKKAVSGICLEIFGGFASAVGEYFEIVMVFMGGIFLSFSLGAMFTTVFALTPISEEFVWRRTYFTVFSVFALLLPMLLIMIWSGLILKKLRRGVMISIVVYVLALGLSALEANRYVDFYDGQIVTRNLWESKEYSQKDIAHYRISAENDAIQMTLFMQDGKSIKLVTTSFENSDLYEEKYSGDYSYIADYVQELEEQGIPGELQDLKVLREEVKGLNKEEQQGLERIVQQMGESEESSG